MARSAPSPRSADAWLRFLTLSIAAAPTPALAGAWIAPEGGQEIVTAAVGVHERDGAFAEGSAYFELPTSSENVSFVAAPWYVRGGDDADDEGWRAEATLGLKAALVRARQGAMAVQGGLVWQSEPGQGCGEAGIEARWLGGVNFGRRGTAFLNLEAAARAQEGGCESRRYDVTAGYQPREGWLALAQVFVDERFEGEPEVQGQISLVRLGSQGRGIQVGVRARLDGEATEGALVLGLWGRPIR